MSFYDGKIEPLPTQKKTLTEQWREGTLSDDTYYWKVCKENRIADKYEMYDYTKVCDVNKIECLAPVPTYDEYKKLKEQIEEANKLLAMLPDSIKPYQRYKEKYGVKPLTQYK